MKNPKAPPAARSPLDEAPALSSGPALAVEEAGVSRAGRIALAYTVAVCVALAAMVGAVFGQTLWFDFINFDDPEYVYDNPVVAQGLTPGGFAWAFSHFYSSNWHPLTWISHMADCELFGMNPAGHHFSNVVLHGVAAILLFLLLRQMTGSLWRSAFAAAVFAVHPLRVESVAWVAERKDILSGIFFMLALWAYVCYTRAQPRSPVRFLAVVGCMAAGLLCKPMLVTLPFVLLLLDYWPLNRFAAAGGSHGVRASILEKTPLFVLSAGSCWVTIVAQRGATQGLHGLPLWIRAGNGAVAAVTYLRQMVCPAGLALLYPHPGCTLRFWEAALAVGLLAGISMAVLHWRKNQPWLVTGWFWYLGMLVPVLGIVQVGIQARADRYTYLPQIGLGILIAWTAGELSARLPFRRWVLAGAGGAFVAALLVCARVQTSYWSDSERLWNRTLALTRDNYVAQGDLGMAILKKGRFEEGILHFRKALQINPGYTDAANNLGYALLLVGRGDEAIAQLRGVLARLPDNAVAHNHLGHALQEKGLLDEAIAHNRRALELQPVFPLADFFLGLALFQKGEVNESVAHCVAAVKLLPKEGVIHYILANGLWMQGRLGEAVSQYEEALRLQPGIVNARNNLAWVLATAPNAAIRNGAKAVELAEDANRVANGGDANILSTLAAAYAEAGRFSEAQVTAQRALELTDPRALKAVDRRKAQIRAYAADKPFRDGGAAPK